MTDTKFGAITLVLLIAAVALAWVPVFTAKQAHGCMGVSSQKFQYHQE